MGNKNALSKRILYVFRSPRQHILEQASKTLPDSMLFGLNHLRDMGYAVDFFDIAYTYKNIFRPLFYPLEKIIIREIGMGFKLDQATSLLPRISSYDIIICTSDVSGLPFLFYKYIGLIKKPVIILSSGLAGALRPKLDSWVARFYKRIFSAIDHLTVYSHVEKDFFINNMGIPEKKISYIPYGTDWKFFSSIPKTKPRLISAVGVDSGRDYKTFFEAVRHIDEQVVVACHPDNINHLKIPKNVTCKFLINTREVRSIFAQSKVVVVPCYERYRSAGQMVALEAASAGRPLIVSAIKGMTGAFSFKHGKHLIYVPPENPQALNQAIIYLLEHKVEAERMGKEASSYVRHRYTSKHLAQNIHRIITSF